ncbi:MAG: transposase family protein [Tardiphaga sp.]|nr:transposase family protein [Tardiphaga sp.]
MSRRELVVLLAGALIFSGLALWCAISGTLVNDGATLLYRASKYYCDVCKLKLRCCPKMPSRKVPRSIYERARDVARSVVKTEAYVTSRRERKKIEMLFDT